MFIQYVFLIFLGGGGTRWTKGTPNYVDRFQWQLLCGSQALIATSVRFAKLSNWDGMD